MKEIWLVERDKGTEDHTIYAAYSTREKALATVKYLFAAEEIEWEISGVIELDVPIGMVQGSPSSK